MEGVLADNKMLYGYTMINIAYRAEPRIRTMAPSMIASIEMELCDFAALVSDTVNYKTHADSQEYPAEATLEESIRSYLKNVLSNMQEKPRDFLICALAFLIKNTKW